MVTILYFASLREALGCSLDEEPEGGRGVELMGLEPTTPCLQSRCSSQLSYVPVMGPPRIAVAQARSRGVRERTGRRQRVNRP